MTQITTAQIKELRERTGVGMMDCKRALEAANGDMDAAIKYLREKGISKAEAKAQRETREGIVYAYIHSNSKVGVLIEVNCETDFVANTDAFKQLCKDLAMQIAATNPLAITPEEIDPAILEREREIAANKAVNDKKPENIIPKIVEGHLAKFAKEHALMEQEFIKDPSITVKSLITDAVAKLGENIKINRFARFSVGN
ncbi:MAG TPA: translation elongation factor Ts [Candidatus Cloacimonadota bacterium]|nr:translation elongation factor Ts [Candidatus Cloacimonadota bacterium]HQL15248.1 translation elongation factor Ts [Candidatus Cloacimonadota bacterium]